MEFREEIYFTKDHTVGEYPTITQVEILSPFKRTIVQNGKPY